MHMGRVPGRRILEREKGCDLHPLLALLIMMCVVGVVI